MFSFFILLLSIPASGVTDSHAAELAFGPFNSNSTITVSGLNEFRFANGYNLQREEPQPWDYLTNTTDVSITTEKLYLKTRFAVEEPSMGFNPPEPVHREYFSKRTIGMQLNKLNIEAGHVGAQFGRGLTLSCKEDREIERYSLLDGVYGIFRHELFTLQGIAGRPYHMRNAPRLLEALGSWGRTDTLNVQTAPDLYERSLISGIHTELFLPFEKYPVPFLSSGSLSGGVVKYDVHSRNMGNSDMKSLWLPSAALNISSGNMGLSVESSLLLTGPDTLDRENNTVQTYPRSRSTYASVDGSIGDVSFLAEYKSYYYDRSTVVLEDFSGYLIPPAVRYIHSWHLLNKHLIANLMGNELAYNVLLNWSPFETALLTGNVTIGGRHEQDNQCTVEPQDFYWELYTEWQQEIGDRIAIKTGIDYGKIDPDPPNTEVTFRTLAGLIEAGPYRDMHSFKITVENQLNDKPIRLDNGGSHIQYVYNFLTTLGYSFSHWLTVSYTFEHEELPFRNEQAADISTITAQKRDYGSVGILVKPIAGTTITGEYGSMSGGKKCTLGTCVDLPPFKGLKVTIESVF